VLIAARQCDDMALAEPIHLTSEMIDDFACFYPEGSDKPEPLTRWGDQFNFAIYDAEGRQTICSCVKEIVEAVAHWDTYVRVHVDFWDQHASYYMRALSNGTHDHPVINGRKYSIALNNENPGAGDGFSGAEFTIVFNDHYVRTTRNLWFNGIIPSYYRRMMADNAVFADKSIAHKLRWDE
jgi:hypothetical protein